MKGAHSISTRRAYGVQRVCRVWHRARSSVYARRHAPAQADNEDIQPDPEPRPQVNLKECFAQPQGLRLTDPTLPNRHRAYKVRTWHTEPLEGRRI